MCTVLLTRPHTSPANSTPPKSSRGLDGEDGLALGCRGWPGARLRRNPQPVGFSTVEGLRLGFRVVRA